MHVKATFEEVDWQGNLIEKVHCCEHSFTVSPAVLMKASIENSSETLEFPTTKRPKQFLYDDLKLNYNALTSLVKAEATFKGWKLVIWDSKVKDTGKMRWEIA